MPSSDRSPLRIAELVLALLVALVVVLIAANVPWYPTWPTLGGFPIDPELVVPWLLGVVALVRAIREGLAVGPVVVAVLCVVTASVATLSLQTLYSGTSGGAFAGGLFTLAAGISLAFVVIARNVVHEVARRELIGTARNRFDGS